MWLVRHPLVVMNPSITGRTSFIVGAARPTCSSEKNQSSASSRRVILSVFTEIGLKPSLNVLLQYFTYGIGDSDYAIFCCNLTSGIHLCRLA
ncbi:hypothetical protein JTE90_019243 [Oedothorax gibbosus]|uniref:Uncharacterized protein n=1 Tax=Oedothorax gibbosus TaxID=931172 RepID=A0AAV6UTH9_9ARAC|nr:hypothetical protein JTE90_019243 [Oedothorax gibbosus]